MGTNDQSLEQEIRNLLATDTDSIALSNKLFGPGGLFGQLASTPAERRAVTQSSLFQDAQQRLSELRRHDASKFSHLVSQFQKDGSESASTIRLGTI